jgi:hypothetical protein
MHKHQGFVQEHPVKSGEPRPPIYFSDAAMMIEFVRSSKSGTLGDCLRVHVPAHYTDQERQELIDLGALPG